MADANSHLERFQNLLRELFQLDLAELDFGLYRLLHLKRDEIEKFLTEQLPRLVDQTFTAVTTMDRGQLRQRIADLAYQIRKQVAEDAILETGKPNPEYEKIILVQEYQAQRKTLAELEATEARKAEVFNHLYSFFSRYYEDGDFIPKRRYGARAEGAAGRWAMASSGFQAGKLGHSPEKTCSRVAPRGGGKVYRVEGGQALCTDWNWPRRELTIPVFRHTITTAFVGGT